MAKVSDDRNAPPQIGRPIGSLAEVQALGVPTRNIATCSAHTERENMGCPMRHLCDRDFRDARPQNEIVQIISSDGNVRTTILPCFDTVKMEAELEDNGGLITVIGGENDKFHTRGSVKRHPERDPNCNDCAKGKCEAYDDVEDIALTCPEFPPAALHDELKKFARRIEARHLGSSRKREQVRAALLGGEDDVPSEKPKKAHARA